MNELKMPQVGASRSEIVANWQPDNPEFWEKFGKKIAKHFHSVFGTYGQPLRLS